MDVKEVLSFCLKKGLLVDEGFLNLFENTETIYVKSLIKEISQNTNQKLLTKETLDKNKDKFYKILSNFPEEKQREFESLKIKLGLSIEISKRISKQGGEEIGNTREGVVLVEDSVNETNNKIGVKDFTDSFRNSFKIMRNILQNRTELKNLISIDKIRGGVSNVSLIGMVYERRITKNGNLILEIEDLTGNIKVLVNKDREEVFNEAINISLDSVAGFVGSGNKNIFFVNKVVFPEAGIENKKRAPLEEYALFAGDLHYGSKLFLRKSFEKFINYLNGEFPNTPEADKIKYLFLVGDLVAGVGVYPGQEKDLEIKDIEKQFISLAELLGNIRKDIKIIVSPGNHDGVRLMEPQPKLDKKYAWPIYNLGNVIVTGNPARINIGMKKSFSGFDVLTYHGFSFPYFAQNIPMLMVKKTLNTPHKIMKYLLRNRHLAAPHTSVQYSPLDSEHLIIKKIPDIFVGAHSHKSDVSYYNNILLVSCSTWEDMTSFQKKLGNKPDFCKVPLLNMKTGKIKILDFEER